MKTIEQIKKFPFQCLDGRDKKRLIEFIPESDLKDFGITLKDEHIGKHIATPLTKENILSVLKEDVEFGFEKALNKRGISASFMAEVVQMWNWILEEGLEDFDKYEMYGLPIFKATAVKYGFPVPIGDDSGSEAKYNGR